MGQCIRSIKCTVAALLLASLAASPLMAQQKTIDELYQELLDADDQTHARIANQIISRWERSGSPAMDLLLRRGEEALEEGDLAAAIDHLSALIDHDPTFAEAYHARASAYFQRDLIGPALGDLQMVLRLNPRHFQALFGLGAILEGLDRSQDALEVYQAILDIYPRDPQTQEAIDRVTLALEGRTL